MISGHLSMASGGEVYDLSISIALPWKQKKLIGFIQDVIKANDLLGGTYVEPFAGGASVALYLLYSEYVNTVIINDIDRSIYAFWFSVLNDTENLCRLIKDTAVSVEEWDKQRKIQDQKEESNYLELGFSTFYLKEPLIK